MVSGKMWKCEYEFNCKWVSFACWIICLFAAYLKGVTVKEISFNVTVTNAVLEGLFCTGNVCAWMCDCLNVIFVIVSGRKVRMIVFHLLLFRIANIDMGVTENISIMNTTVRQSCVKVAAILMHDNVNKSQYFAISQPHALVLDISCPQASVRWLIVQQPWQVNNSVISKAVRVAFCL